MSSKDDNFNYSFHPWKTVDEFIEFYETLFYNEKHPISLDNKNNNLDLFIQSLSLENLKKSMIYLIKWDAREDNKMFCLPIILLVNTLIKIKENKINNRDINSSHILAEVIIRVINIIMDQLRKTKKVNTLNMYLIAKNIELPEFIIDIRHASTHKNLPSFNDLVFAVEYTFLWITKKLIEPKYLSFIKEKKYFLFLLNKLTSNENDLGENNNELNYEVKLEPEHLLTIITQIFVNVKNHFIYNKSKNTISYNSDKVKHLIKIFIKIMESEKEVFILMVFSFIYQQINKINSNNIISKDEKTKYKQYLICFVKIIYDNIDKKIKYDLKKYEILFISLYNKNNQIKNEYKIIYEIFNNIFKNSIKNINFENLDELNDDNLYVDLNKIGGKINNINIEKIKDMVNTQEYCNNNDIQENNNKMSVENEGVNNIINKDIREDHNNFNSIII